MFLCSSGTGTGKSTSANGSTNGSTNSSVFRKFAESVKRDTKNEELRASVQKFEEKLTELNQNDSVRRAKEILAKAKADVMKQNETIVADVREKADAVRQAVGSVGSKVGSTLSTAATPVRELGKIIKPYVPDLGESEVVNQVSKTVSEAEESLLENTNIYQYGGFKTKEQREKSRNKTRTSHSVDASTAESTTNPTVADPNAGSSVVVHKDSIWGRKWSNFVDNNRLLQNIFGFKRAYEESNNIFVYFAREITNSISDRFASILSETETARAMREIQSRDPTFHIEKFMKLARETIVPEILDAFLVGDLPTLRVWCSEAMFNTLKANFDTQLKAGCHLDGRVLDMRNLELVTAKLLEQQTPVVVFSFNTQQISYVRDAKGAIIEGAEDSIENFLYVMALTKEAPASNGKISQITHGWKLVELAIRDKNGSW